MEFYPRSISHETSRQEYCEALYEFQPQNPDEIKLVVGAKIRIISRADGK